MTKPLVQHKYCSVKPCKECIRSQPHEISCCDEANKGVDGYHYELERMTLWLCPVHNCQLAGELFKQLAIEHFHPKTPILKKRNKK